MLSGKQYIGKIKQFIPPLLPQFHKGQVGGKVVVIGGCSDYTGAPYFSAHAASLFGCDLAHVVCEHRAAQVIKTYSPNLMVHPYLFESDTEKTMDMDKVTSLLQRIDVAVIGPGLGRDPKMLSSVVEIIHVLKSKGIPMILDADALQIVCQNPSLVTNYTRCILTPNVVEFGRLCKALGVEDGASISQRLGGVTVVQKGAVDRVFQGKIAEQVSLEGSNKRVGGQGDTLTGVMATLVAWATKYQQGLWDHDNSLTESELYVLSALGASLTLRVCAQKAFARCGRSMQTTDLNNTVGEAYESLFS